MGGFCGGNRLGRADGSVQIPTSFPNPPGGQFTYQFADPITGVPISTIAVTPATPTAKVSVYLLQTGGTPSDLFTELGVQGLGVRLNYASSSSILRVPVHGARKYGGESQF